MQQNQTEKIMDYSELPEALMQTEIRLYWESIKICDKETSVIHPELKKTIVYVLLILFIDWRT